MTFMSELMADPDMRKELDRLAGDDRVLALGALQGIHLAPIYGVCLLLDDGNLAPVTKWVAHIDGQLVIWPKARHCDPRQKTCQA